MQRSLNDFSDVWSYKNEADLRELYVDRQMNVYEVADRCDCASSTVGYWLKKFDIERRGSSRDRISRSELIDSLQNLADRLGRTPSYWHNNDHGKYSGPTYQKEFGSWNAALEAAGLERNRKDLLEYECERCGDTFERPRYYEQNGRSVRFCSRECREESGRSTVECDYCGNEFKVRKSYAKNGLLNFCSRECYINDRSDRFSKQGNPNWVDKMIVECDSCGAELERRPKYIENHKYLFCDESCQADWISKNMVGEDHPNWNGGSGYYGPNYQRQRRKALERDGYQCRVCGMGREEHREKYGRDLHCHHRRKILNFKENGEIDYEAANKLSNLVILCRDHHQNMWEDMPVQIEV